MVLHVREKILFAVLGILLVIIACMGIYFVQVSTQLNQKIAERKKIKNEILKRVQDDKPKTKVLNFENSMVFLATKPGANDIVLKIQEENIYYSDYSVEVGAHSANQPLTKQIQLDVLNKLVDDSLKLQYCQTKTYMPKLPSTVYNSSNKQYPLRLEAILECEEKIAKFEFKTIRGNGLSIFFYNIQSPSMSKEEAREFVKSKIVLAYDKVQKNELSIEKAIASLSFDPDFAKLPNLKNTVTPFDFDTQSSTKISISPSFDKIIWDTPASAMTPLYRTVDVKSDEAGVPADDVYMFGFVKEKSNKGYLSNADFLEKNRPLYQIEVY